MAARARLPGLLSQATPDACTMIVLHLITAVKMIGQAIPLPYQHHARDPITRLAVNANAKEKEKRRMRRRGRLGRVDPIRREGSSPG